jgi:hypothetical protein
MPVTTTALDQEIDMHVGKILSRWFGTKRIIAHRSREVAVARTVQALMIGQRLSLTHLGRHRQGRAHVKHHIKAVDRLLANAHLHTEIPNVYREMARRLLEGVARPVIVVDWSDFELGREWLMLKAAVPLGGRAISVFQRVFPFARYNSPSAHAEFLMQLKAVLPPSCRPLIVTDAGFRGPWFRAVEANGWDWVGRIRNRIKYFNKQTGRWRYTDSLYAEATATVKHVGRVALSRRHRYEFSLYLVRAYRPRRGRPPATGPKHQNTTLYRRLHKAPWLLATSLPHAEGIGRRVKAVYAQRMQIEETFRDLKCHRWGLGLRYALSHSAARLEVLLLIGALATLLFWIAGLFASKTGQAHTFQANTERRRRVLSVVFLGQQLLRTNHHPPPAYFILDGLRSLRSTVAAAAFL